MVKQGSTPGAKIWQVSAPSPTRETLTPIERGPGNAYRSRAFPLGAATAMLRRVCEQVCMGCTCLCSALGLPFAQNWNPSKL